MYAAKRLCCGPGEERRDPTKQFYSRMFLVNTVILGDHMANTKASSNLEALPTSPSLAQTLPSDAVLDALKMIPRRFS
jgi:hypothetical protein